jgi:hypothetical protein
MDDREGSEPIDADASSTYDRAQSHFIAAVVDCEPDRVVPACPAWTVHDLLAHQVHQLRSARDGSFPVEDSLAAISPGNQQTRALARARQDMWIADGVNRLRRRSTTSLVHEWHELRARSGPAVRQALVPDVVVHLFDLLGVTQSRALRHDEMVGEALDFWTTFVPHPSYADHHPFEVLRVITGRRGREQAMWAPDAAALYGWRTKRLVE